MVDYELVRTFATVMSKNLYRGGKNAETIICNNSLFNKMQDYVK